MSNITIELIDHMGDDLQRCTRCETTKPLVSFDFRPERGSHRTVCKVCRSDSQRTRYAKYVKTSPFKNKVTKAKARSKALNLPFDLDEDYLSSIWTGVCPVYECSISIELGRSDFSAELDRIDPQKGYVRGNVKFLSRKANRIKGEGTAEDFKKIINYINKVNNVPDRD